MKMTANPDRLKKSHKTFNYIFLTIFILIGVGHLFFFLIIEKPLFHPILTNEGIYLLLGLSTYFGGRYWMELSIVGYKTAENINNQNYDEALKRIKKRLNSLFFFTDESRARLLLMKGHVYFRKGELQKAVKVLNRGLEIDFTSYHNNILYARAVVENKMDKHEKAVQSLIKSYKEYERTLEITWNPLRKKFVSPEDLKKKFLENVRKDEELEELRKSEKIEKLYEYIGIEK